MDHYFQMENLGGPPEPMLEGYTSLGFLAGQTSRIELGLLVTGVTYRHPGLLAKIVTTLDVLSGGRAMLGLGAAWYEREHRGLGVPYPPTKERFERLEETLQIVRQAWGDRRHATRATHYRLEELTSSPSRSGRAARGSWSAAPASARRSAWSRSTPTPATSSPPRPTRSPTSSTCSAGTATTLGRDYDEIAKTIVGTLNRPLDDVDALAGLDGGVRRPRHQPGLGRPRPGRPGRLDRADVRAGGAPPRRRRSLSNPRRPGRCLARVGRMPSGSDRSPQRTVQRGQDDGGAGGRRAGSPTPWLVLPVDLFHQIRTRPDADLTDRQWQDVLPPHPRGLPPRPRRRRRLSACDVLGDHVLSEPWRLDDLLRLSVGPRRPAGPRHLLAPSELRRAREGARRPRPRHGAVPSCAWSSRTATAT